MSDLGPSTSRRVETHSGVSVCPRPRSASEAIRRRVNQRLASTGNSFEPPELIQTSYSAQASYSKPGLSSPSTQAASNRESHLLKRKKTTKADNRGPDTGLGIPFIPIANNDIQTRHLASQSRRKGRSFVMAKRCNSHDEQIDESSDNEPTSTGPIAASEVDRLKMEVDSLKQALQESKKANKRQSKVHLER
jgi:hypothetical protein